ncbi:70 kDa peptidyl-prolyl isomerase isoform X3 [Hevea brasiliensis]|uniref:70 kDa peptidyl-prolyl isomerase isoform X3 n=1 Tax=Hevea brasiliensis TaxID=3981 RepID=UPI0025FB9B7A|nr:70 kDa peptidyl-prolyl isomerase isoform X3 [Hevea brasiliensis]
MALASMKSSMEADIQVRDSKFSEKQIGKQGLRKKILKKGISWQTPFPGDEVEVHLSGHVEGGACLDSTRDKGVPFIFKLGQGEVIKGLDDGAATMKKGERAIFKVPPNLAYEEAGSPPLIPSNAALFFDVEMLSWSSIRDIAGDGGILKRIIKEGEGWATPRDGDKVLVKYEAGLENGLLVSKSEEGEEFHIGDGYLCPAFGKAVKTMRKGEEAELSVKCSYQINEGLDRAIMTMKKGEQALVRVSAEYLSGHEISGMFPANSVLHYEVELIDFIKEKPFWKMGAFEKLEACERKKMDGNALFKAEKFWRASKKYEKATNYIDFDHSFTDDQKCLAKGLRLLCNLNNAACKLKLGEYLEASRLCTKVLEQEPFNIKALFRRSQAYLKTLELEKAEDDINRALTIDPNNRDVKLVYKELKDKQREYVKYQADFFSTMISRMS